MNVISKARGSRRDFGMFYRANNTEFKHGVSWHLSETNKILINFLSLNGIFNEIFFLA